MKNKFLTLLLFIIGVVYSFAGLGNPGKKPGPIEDPKTPTPGSPIDTYQIILILVAVALIFQIMNYTRKLKLNK